MDTELETCELRDTKKLYARARNGEIKNFTGVNSLFEIPNNCEFKIKNNKINYLELLEYIDN